MISMIENESHQSSELFARLYNRVGRAHRIGITGPPGAGKSTIVEKMTIEQRKKGLTVAIVAVDPTSPFSGGAILGDRVRMSEVFMDKGVFIRSMATRGSLGGLASKTQEVCDLLDAFGKDVIIIETVGVGQAELDIIKAVHTTIVVLVPESGNGIQAMKAGLMEIGDIFVVNKSDRDGADQLRTEIEMMLEMVSENKRWRPAIFQTVARDGKGICELVDGVMCHYDFLQKNDLLRSHREENIRSEIMRLVEAKNNLSLWKNRRMDEIMKELVEEVCRGEMTPSAAADRIWEEWKRVKLGE